MAHFRLKGNGEEDSEGILGEGEARYGRDRFGDR